MICNLLEESSDELNAQLVGAGKSFEEHFKTL
jgi:hypothetical protein